MVLETILMVILLRFGTKVPKKELLVYCLYRFVSVCISLYQFVSVCIGLYWFVSVCISLYQFVYFSRGPPELWLSLHRHYIDLEHYFDGEHFNLDHFNLDQDHFLTLRVSRTVVQKVWKLLLFCCCCCYFHMFSIFSHCPHTIQYSYP